jgi:hypothetical protein
LWRTVETHQRRCFGTPLPRDSGVARFLAGPNEFGWDIKRKLLWLGINSYLFRFHKWKITKSRGGSQTS